MPRHRPLPLIVAVALGCLVSGLTLSRADEPPKKTDEEKEDYVLLHVIASEAGREGKPQEIPKALKPFEKNLHRYDFRKFELAGSKTIPLEKKTTTITLPKGFGTVLLSSAGRGSVKVDLQGPDKKTRFAGTLPVKTQYFLATDKMRNDKGEQYILILVRKQPEKPKPKR
ncbi:MAG: hypothetical protein KDC38_11835 [Planctomycetes bacterium]|nr:hypothetical protein [Planctomycetota bacterium]